MIIRCAVPLNRVNALGGDADIQVRWRQYLRRTKLPELQLEQVLDGINRFLRCGMR